MILLTLIIAIKIFKIILIYRIKNLTLIYIIYFLVLFQVQIISKLKLSFFSGNDKKDISLSTETIIFMLVGG